MISTNAQAAQGPQLLRHRARGTPGVPFSAVLGKSPMKDSQLGGLKPMGKFRLKQQKWAFT